MNIEMSSYFDIAYEGSEATLEAKLLYDGKTFDDIKHMKDNNNIHLLYYSLFGKNVKLAIYFLENGFDIDVNPNTKYNELHIVAKFFNENPTDSLKIAKILLKRGVDVNYKTFNYQRTPFYEFIILSSKNYSDEMVEFLELCIDKNPYIHCSDIYGNTLKSYFNSYCKNISSKSYKIKNYINNKKIDIFENDYFKVAQYGTYENFLLKLKKSKDKIEYVKNLYDENNVSILSYSLSGGNYSLSLFLLEKDVKLNFVSKKFGFNELHYISNRLCDDEALNIAYTLVSKGANLNLQDSIYKNSPFWYICKFVLDNPYNKYFDFVKFCFSKKPDIDFLNNKNESIRKLIINSNNSTLSRMIIDF